MEHVFIVNPIAGKGRSLKFAQSIQEYKFAKADTYKLLMTSYPGHASLLSREYINSPNTRVYAVGGDGTLNEVVNGIAGGSCSLGIIPAGCGNDFARVIYSNANYHDSSPNEILKLCIEGIEKKIDLVKINNKHYINISSVGFDAQVAERANKIKKLPGFFKVGYTFAILLTLAQNKARHMTVNIDGKEVSSKFLMVTIANGRYYGGGMMPAPDAKIDDGILDICTIAHKKRYEIPFLFPKYAKGLHHTLKGVTFYKCKEVTIICDEDAPVNIDGEVFISSKVNFKIVPSGISVVFPKT